MQRSTVVLKSAGQLKMRLRHTRFPLNISKIFRTASEACLLVSNIHHITIITIFSQVKRRNMNPVLNTRKCGPERTPYLVTFHVVYIAHNLTISGFGIT